MLLAFTSNVQASTPSLPEDEILYGDANDDGIVNILDIITIINYIMGGNPDPFNFEAADVNNDGVINILDVIFDVNVVMETPGTPCAGMPTVLYEGKTYNTLQIGDQCWFKENLNVGTKINSTQAGFQQQDNGTIEKYCYNNDEAYCDIYGGLYEWPEAMQYDTTAGAQGICPPGWHIPTDNEWKILEGTVDSQYPVGDPEWNGIELRGLDAGGKLKETGLEHWETPNEGATNQSGFTGLPGGYRGFNDGAFFNLGSHGYYWASSQNSTSQAWYRNFNDYSAEVYRDDSYKERGFPVRCLKGCWPQPSQANAGPDQVNAPGTSTTLAGNIPTYGTGVWHIITGTGGTVADTTSPTSTFTGVADSTYSLTWTITTQCGSSADTVVISFAGGTFTCGDDLVYEGQSYATVLIGTQCWMAENLNVGTMISSTQGGYQQEDNDIIEKYCYENDITNCVTYGGLYEWPEAMQYSTAAGAQGICPLGWHMPTDNEWKVLEGTVDSEYGVGDWEWNKTGSRGLDAGGNLKEEGTVHWIDPNEGATNSSGFTGLPGGYRSHYYGNFYNLGTYGYFWSSSPKSSVSAWFRYLNYDNAYVNRNGDDTDYGRSVRCLKD